MGTIEELKDVSNTAVRKLRQQKFNRGKPFLIWSDKLPSDQSYLEYPDHSVKIVVVSSDRMSFEVVKELSKSQSRTILKSFNLV